MLRILKQPNITNSLWIIGEQIVQMVISFVISILSARYLGPTNFGTLNYTASIVTMFSSIATLGMESVVIKKIIDSPDFEGRYLGGCIGLRTASSILSTISIAIIVIALNPGDSTKLLMALLQSLQLVFRSIHILDSWFQRHLKSKYVSIGKMIAGLVAAAYKVFLLIQSKSVIWFAVNNTLSDFISAIILYYFYRREGSQRLEINLKFGRDVLKDSYHFIISGLMVAIYGQMDKVMIGGILTDTEVGLYSIATGICGMWVFIPIAIINSYRPMIMEIKQKGNENKYLLRLKQLYSAIIWLCIGVSIIVCLIGGWIIQIMYGMAYTGATSALKIAIWFETFSMIGTARGIWIVSENKNRYVKYYLGLGVIVNLVLNSVLIPKWGIDGAAAATLATQITTSIIAPLCFKDTRIHTKYVWDAFVFSWIREVRGQK